MADDHDDQQGHGYRIAVVDRAFDVLELLATAPGPLGVTDIARQVGSTKSATWRMLVNLEARGYAVKDPATSRYSIGPRLADLGLRGGSRANLVQAARPYLESLSRTFGETANLGVLDSGQVLYIDIVESPRDLRMAARVGARDALHATALGKAMLAYLPGEMVEEALAQPLEARTTRTITTPDRIRDDLTRIRESGIASEVGENEVAAACFGVPVFGPDGDAIAAISLAGPEQRMTESGADRICEALRLAGEAVTARIGGRWRTGPDRNHDEGR